LADVEEERLEVARRELDELLRPDALPRRDEADELRADRALLRPLDELRPDDDRPLEPDRRPEPEPLPLLREELPLP
jgi:hypothetical protein